jgi:hypothetical protein
MPLKDNANDIDFDYLFKKLNIQDDKEKNLIKAEILGFDAFYECVRKQPISSFIRAVELKCRTLPVFDEFFNIDYGEMVGTNVKIGSCMLFPNAERFRILLPRGATEEEIRNITAHETGHLYCAVRFLEKFYKERAAKNPKFYRKILQAYLDAERGKKFEIYENRANVIGISVINKRSYFYKEKLPKNSKCLCKNFKPIVDDFERLKKLKSS